MLYSLNIAIATAEAIGIPLYAGPKSISNSRSWSTIALAYAFPSSARVEPVSKCPVLKKYGLFRPDFSVKFPNWSTLLSNAAVMKSFLYCFISIVD